MPTVIDSLVVTLGLDTAALVKGQKDATNALAKTGQEAQKAGKGIEESSRRAGDGIESLGRKILGLYALFTAGQGIKEFIADLTSSDAAVGRLAKNLDMSGKTLTAWQNAATVAGSSADDVSSAFSSLTQEAQNAALTGQSRVIPYFRALGVNLADATGKMRPATDIMMDLNRQFSAMDPARATAFGRDMGFSDGFTNFLEMAPDKFRALIAEQQKYAATAEDIDAAQKRQSGWRELLIISTSLGRTILTSLTPAILGAMRAVRDWVSANQEWIKSQIVEKVGEFVTWLKSIDWGKVGRDFSTLGTNIGDIATAFAGVLKAIDGQSPLVVAFEAFGALLVAKVLLPIRNIVTAIAELGKLPIPAVLAGALGLAGYLADNTQNNFDPWAGESAGEIVMRAADPGAADRRYGKRGEQLPQGPHHGVGVKAAPHDTRTLWQRTMPKALGGKDAPTAVAPDGSPENRLRRAARGPRSGGDTSHVDPAGPRQSSRNPNMTPENAASIVAAAKDLGTTPEDLATVIGYETVGTYSPSKWGGKGGNYMGLIQFGPNERAQYGANDKQSFGEQMEAVKRYLKDRGFKPGMGLMDLYSTINAGSPGHYDRSDGNGTVRTHVARMQAERAAKARAFVAMAPSSGDAASTTDTISDAEALAAHDRLVKGGQNPADRAIYDKYVKQQNMPKSAGPVTVDHAVKHVLSVLAHARKLTHHNDNTPVPVMLSDKSGRAMLGDRVEGGQIARLHHQIHRLQGHQALNGLGRMVATASSARYGNIAHHVTNHSTETRIGEMHVHPQTGDGRRFASDFHDSLRREGVVRQANYGLA